MKECFPRLPLCWLLDGLFAEGPTLERCEPYGWKYLIVLSYDALPTFKTVNFSDNKGGWMRWKTED